MLAHSGERDIEPSKGDFLSRDDVSDKSSAWDKICCLAGRLAAVLQQSMQRNHAWTEVVEASHGFKPRRVRRAGAANGKSKVFATFPNAKP